MARLLSKSAYVQGLTCDKMLWMYQNAREELPEVDEGTQAIFDQGHEIGAWAKMLYPDGIEIDWDKGQDAGIAQTREYLKARRPLFEAGFISGRTHARADILKPAAQGRWDLIEVKSSGKVKEEHLEDVAFQKHVYQSAGIRIGRCSVMHVNTEYERNGEVDAKGLLKSEDVTAEIKDLSKDVPAEIDRMLTVISKKTCPEPAPGPQCLGCDLESECLSFLPKRNVLSLTGPKQKFFDLIDEGILKIRDIPEDFPLSERQLIQVEAVTRRKPHVEKEGIRAFLDRLSYPMYFLDFETFNAAVPPYELLRPYENVPFQYSLHTIGSAGRGAIHDSWLADGNGDPRPEVLSRLKARLGRKGSIVAYNAGFELKVLQGCTEHYSQFDDWVESIRTRVVDLLEPFRKLQYYHPDQEGSTSLKAVLPPLTGKDYGGLDIADGTTASLRFREMAFGNINEAQRRRTRRALEKYCSLDTEGMVAIVNALRQFCR